MLFQVLKSWLILLNIKELRKFLGFAGYYRRFVKGYSGIAKPLNDLLVDIPQHRKGEKKRSIGKEWQWTTTEQTAFDRLIECLTTSPILAYADFSKPFILHTDASGTGLGAVLYQKQAGLKRVIAYASRGLSKSERNYPAHKLEFLALKWAVCDKFHDYLYGPKFEVITDNNPLTYALSSAKLNATGHR